MLNPHRDELMYDSPRTSFVELSEIQVIDTGRRSRLRLSDCRGMGGHTFVSIERQTHDGDGRWRTAGVVRIAARDVREVAGALEWAADQLEAAAL